VTYRITPQCGHPSLMGDIHDHGPECLFAFEWRESMPGPGEATFVPYASAEEAGTGSFVALSIHQQMRAEMMR
jgi:hypothetical protein